MKRKKKGRPSKADMAARAQSASERDIRRSLRLRNVRYNIIDYDEDYIEDEEEDEEEEEEAVGRREKKLKLVVKLHSNENVPSTIARGLHVHGNVASEEDEEEERGNKPLKKRKINGVHDGDYDSDNIDNKNDNCDDHGDDDGEVCIESCVLYGYL